MKLQTKFQDEDFELGEVVNADIATMPDGRIKLQALAKKGGFHTIFYDSLEKIYSEWQDYEEPKTRDIIDFSNVRLPVVEIHRKVRDCSGEEADLIISLDQKTGALTYRVVNEELGYDFVYTPLEFGYVAWKIIGGV